MQSDTFAKAIPLLKESKYNINIEEFIGFLKHYKKGNWIYPTAIHRKLKIDVVDVYNALEVLNQEGIIEQYLEIYCPNCQRYTGQYFRTIGEVPEEIYCDNCDYEIRNPLKHASVIYKVL